MIIPQKREQQCFNLNDLYISLQDKHRNVFMYKADDEIFFYKPLGRKDYKELCEDATLSEYDKEEIVCDLCVLWPEGYDFENCDNAGLPTLLSKEILHNSFLDDMENRYALITMYRTEMYERDNQITCVIHEAFPEFSVEEIENWDMETTAYYLARSEWTLSYLRGVALDMVYADNPNAEVEEIEEVETPVRTAQQQTKQKSQAGDFETIIGETIEERQARLEREGALGKKEKLSPEKLAQLRAQYPEIDWTAQSPEAGTSTVDTTPVALRTGWH